ncbi:DUF1648 domain-containing protein [Filibacter tadaridae]|uniref:DUF1648 domain-containing protein n=1 Tax=Filibacter tadaridae TaxID=2483811 RepID=A0A3P5XNZ4_9BACL|nr:DUF1648 domain-containing protein [Filibacter tadaridae]VDC32082.1 hypothetical protein FILTAD_02578 [Filibacter tadaridae]
MNHRPKLIVQKSNIERVHDWVCVIVIIGMFAFTIQAIFQMPDSIPIHENGKGEINGWGSRWISIIMPFILVVIYIPLLFLQKYPEKHNYPERLSKGNVYAFYRNSKILISWLKFEFVLAFAYFNWYFVKVALGQTSPPLWYISFALVAVILTVIIIGLQRLRID